MSALMAGQIGSLAEIRNSTRRAIGVLPFQPNRKRLFGQSEASPYLKRGYAVFNGGKVIRSMFDVQTHCYP
jgi:hypothetical protein